MTKRQEEKAPDNKRLTDMTIEELLKDGYNVRLDKDGWLQYLFEARG